MMLLVDEAVVNDQSVVNELECFFDQSMGITGVPPVFIPGGFLEILRDFPAPVVEDPGENIPQRGRRRRLRERDLERYIIIDLSVIIKHL